MPRAYWVLPTPGCRSSARGPGGDHPFGAEGSSVPGRVEVPLLLSTSKVWTLGPSWQQSQRVWATPEPLAFEAGRAGCTFSVGAGASEDYGPGPARPVPHSGRLSSIQRPVFNQLFHPHSQEKAVKSEATLASALEQNRADIVLARSLQTCLVLTPQMVLISPETSTRLPTFPHCVLGVAILRHECHLVSTLLSCCRGHSPRLCVHVHAL